MDKIVGMTYPNAVVANSKIDDAYKEQAEKLAADMIEEFLKLCEVPHASKHVDKMRQYLYKWGIDHNFDTFIDDSGCVYIDLPASKGCENIPKIIIQSHFDMVAVGASTNKDFIPEETPIKPIYDKKNNCIHTNWITSLGADDGQGLATSMAIAKNNVKHGPLRLLFTYDEETSMQGVKNLSKEVIDSKYLINIDSIYVGIVLRSAAGAFYSTLSKNMQLIYAKEKACIFNWQMAGFTGGHSGEDIHKGRGSTIIMLTKFLTTLFKENINFNICEIDAGTFMNAIPTKIKLKIVVGSKYVERTEQIANEIFEKAQRQYTDGHQLWSETSSEIAFATQMMSISDSLKILDILMRIPNGVITYLEDSYDEKGRKKPETSSNIGTLKIKHGKCEVTLLYRSSVEKVLKSDLNKLERLANYHKFDFTIEGIFPAWPKVENNPLNDLFIESYKKICNFEGMPLDIHSGLECGYLASKYPDLIMASIGCDIINEHTVKETLFTNTIPPFFASLLYVLENLR